MNFLLVYFTLPTLIYTFDIDLKPFLPTSGQVTGESDRAGSKRTQTSRKLISSGDNNTSRDENIEQFSEYYYWLATLLAPYSESVNSDDYQHRCNNDQQVKSSAITDVGDGSSAEREVQPPPL